MIHACLNIWILSSQDKTGLSFVNGQAFFIDGGKI